MKDLLHKIGINETGYYSGDDNYIIDFENSNQFNTAFSRLEKSGLVEENDDASVINLTVTNILYVSDDFALNLIADFGQDIYKLVVTKLEGEDK